MPTAGTSYTKFFDNVTSISNESMTREIVVQSFNENAFYREVMKNVEYNRFVDDKFFIPVRAGKATNIKYLDGAAGEIDLHDDQLFTRSWYTPAILAGAVLYSDTEKEQVEGNEDALTSLQKQKMEVFQDSVGEIINQNLYGDGSLSTTLGLGALVPVSPGAFVVGAIDEAQYPFWKSYYLPAFGSWKTYGPKGTGINKLLKFIHALTYNQKQPDLLLMDYNTVERYETQEESKVQIFSADMLGKISISASDDSLSYKGVRIVPDRDADPDTIFGLHTDLFRMVVSPGMNMRVSPTRYLERQPLISFNFVAFRHQLVCKRRNVNGRADGIAD